MADITYCAYAACPLKKCERHISKVSKKNKYVSVCDFAPTCRDYLSYVLEDIENESKT